MTASVDTASPQARTRTASLADLIAARTAADVLVRTPTRAMLGRGGLTGRAADVRRGALAEDVRSLASADRTCGGSGIVLGAIPFADGGAVNLQVPDELWLADPAGAVGDPGRTAAGGWHARTVPSRAVYAAAVDAAVAAIERSELVKVVLARALDLRPERPYRHDELVRHLLRALLHRQAGDHVFAVPLAAGRTLVGASPELLVERHGMRIRAVPLAGSAPRSADPGVDRRNAEQLLASIKARHEHAVVVAAVTDALAPHCQALEVPDTPSLVRTPTMWHLATRVRGRVPAAGAGALDLALALHPTPAVCGTPPAAARLAIGQLEPFDRGFFAGAVGWSDADGNGEWSVTLRCAEVRDDVVRLFAGAGVVAGSIGAEEASETSDKFRTMLDALGADERS